MDLEQCIEELKLQQSKYGNIINSLQGNDGYESLMRLVKEDKEIIDDAWHLENDPVKLAELRARKTGYDYVLSLLDTVVCLSEKCQMEIDELSKTEDIHHV